MRILVSYGRTVLKKVAICAARIGLVVVVGVGGLLTFVNLGLPRLRVGPAREHRVEVTPERVARGRYLAHHVNVCIDCHSTRDWSRFSGPIVVGTEGKGGERFAREYGFPGEFYAKNITPTALSTWTDGELERLMTTGVARDGRAMFPVMPYPNYAELCQDDVDALIAYVRTLAPLAGAYPDAQLDFPANLLVKTLPFERERPACPSPADTVAYGAYLLNAASCVECHTKTEYGRQVGARLAGGFAFTLPGGVVTSANITPDVETGIGNWTKEAFIARFRGHLGVDEPVVRPGEMQTLMPWQMYSGMSEQDLGAIYEYLRTVAPVNNSVVKWSPR